MKKQFLEVGKILKTCGLSGAVKVQHWCDSSYVFKNFKYVYFDSEGKLKFGLNVLSFKKNFLILKLTNINSIEQANKFIGKILFARRSDFNLLDNRSFIQDLIGASVVNHLDINLCYGTIVDVLKYSANDVYIVKSSNNKEFLIPVIDEIIVKKKLEKNLILIKPMEGLFDV